MQAVGGSQGEGQHVQVGEPRQAGPFCTTGETPRGDVPGWVCWHGLSSGLRVFPSDIENKEQGKSMRVVKAGDWKDILCLLDCPGLWKEKNGFSFGNLLRYYLGQTKPFSFCFHL